MKKLFISIAFIGAFAAYVFYNNSITSAANTTANSPVTTTADSSGSNAAVTTTNTTSSANTANSAPVTPTKTPVATPTPATTPVVVKKSTGQYVDGSYTGSVADAYYGNVQVRVTVSGGKMTNVTFLQYPNDRSTSISINHRATPQLAAEAIQAQSANVSGVSGASDTSMAFEQSLANALAQAKA